MEVPAPWRDRRRWQSWPSACSTAGAALRASATTGEPQPATGLYALPAADVDALRTWTTQFADPAAAIAAGRVDLDLCFDMMGEHYADPATFADGVLDVRDPEALVYADVGEGPTLVAVEWVSTSPGQVAGIPLHLNHDLDVWVLHAWIGLDNPAGMLADHNAEVGACAAPAPSGGPPAIDECASFSRSPGCV